jgi:ABC-type Na+ efflux pump permease subunit
MSLPAPPPPPLAAADRPPAPDLAEAAGHVMIRQIRSTFRGRRFLAAAILVGLAPLLAALVRNPAPEILARMVLHLHVAFLLPLLAVSFGSGLLHEEAEEGTLTYLFTCPVHRSSIVLGKWAAALACGWGLSLLSLGATLLLTAADPGAMPGFARAAFLAVLLGIPAYLGLFTLLGTIFRRGYIAGLIYCFGFELVVWVIPGAMKRLSVGYFLRSLLDPHLPNKDVLEGYFEGFPADGQAACIAVLATLSVLLVGATLLIVPGKEFQAKNVQG